MNTTSASSPARDRPTQPQPASALAGSSVTQMARHLRAVLLLAGSPHRNPLEQAIGRSRLELPVTADTTLLDRLRDAVADLQSAFDLPHLPLRVQLGPSDPALTRPLDQRLPCTIVEHDPTPYRGTAGLLRDAIHYEPDDAYVLVMLGCQLPLDGLPALLELLAAEPGDIRLLTCPAHPSSGILLARCGALRSIPRIGYIDLKEQALPRLAQHHRVGLVRAQKPATCPVTDLASYLAALRRLHLPAPTAADTPSPRGFHLIEDHAQIHPSALLHDTVVLEHARVGLNAALAHCLVAPGVQVPGQSTAWDRVLTAANT